MAVTNWIGRDPTTGELTESHEYARGSGSADPGTGTVGDLFYNTTSSTLKVYNGSTWVVAGGGATGTSKTFAFFMG